MGNKLSILLVEDDTQACEEMISYADSLDDIIFVGITNNASKAVEIVKDTLPDVVILDLELHSGSGSGLTFLNDIQSNCPQKVPYILITTNNSSKVTFEAARQSGADYIFSKHQDDYSAKTVIDFLRMLKNVIKKRNEKQANNTRTMDSPEQKNKRITRRICAELDKVGISPKAKGYQYLIDGIRIVMDAPARNLCSQIAGNYGKTESSVERAMQNAIAKAWRTTPIDDLLVFYTAKISSEKGVPTITEFIYYYANKLKNEY